MTVKQKFAFLLISIPFVFLVGLFANHAAALCDDDTCGYYEGGYYSEGSYYGEGYYEGYYEGSYYSQGSYYNQGSYYSYEYQTPSYGYEIQYPSPGYEGGYGGGYGYPDPSSGGIAPGGWGCQTAADCRANPGGVATCCTGGPNQGGSFMCASTGGGPYCYSYEYQYPTPSYAYEYQTPAQEYTYQTPYAYEYQTPAYTYQTPPGYTYEYQTPTGSWGPWSDWSACVNGQQSRTRTCTTGSCSGSSIEYQTCGSTCTSAAISASPSIIAPGSSTTITWCAPQACTATSSPADTSWDGAKGTSGTFTATPGYTTTYTISCGTAAQATVTLRNKPWFQED